MLFPLAVKAKIPLIAVTTDDPLNVGVVLSALTGRTAKEAPRGLAGLAKNPQPYLPKNWPAKQLYYIVTPDEDALDLMAAYSALMAAESTLVIVNPETPHHALYDAGRVVCPRSLVEKFVDEYLPDDADVQERDALIASLSGLSYKAVNEVSAMAVAKSKAFTSESVREVRRMFFGTLEGLHQVDTKVLYYQPNEAVSEWLQVDGKLFRPDTPPVLRPRGLLFNGPPGTGKTLGAKFLANELDLPLYHLDIAGLMSKYVGDSEHNLRAALAQVVSSAPCLMLLDEAEKLFKRSDDAGITSRLLSTFLWWLQEHTAPVLVVMTTNDQTQIPPELYRPGRIDKEVSFHELELPAAKQLAKALALKLAGVIPLDVTELNKAVEALVDEKGSVSHARVTQLVIHLLKVAYLKHHTPS